MNSLTEISQTIVNPVDNSSSRKKVNFNGWYLSNAIDSASKASVDQFLPIYATHLGASTGLVGLLSGLFSLVNIFQILWAQISVKIQRTKIFIVLGWLVSAIFYIPMAFLKQGQLLFLLLFRFLQGAFLSAVGPTQTSLMVDHTTSKNRIHRITKFTQVNLIGTLLGAIFGGLIFTILLNQFLLNLETSFFILFIWTTFLGVMTAIIFQHSVPDVNQLYNIDSILFVNQNLRVNAKPSSLSISRKIKAYFTKFKNFWLFTIFVVAFYFTVNLSGPFFIILEIQYYQFSFFQAAFLTSLTTLVQFLISLTLVKYNILDLFGRKFSVICGIMLIALSTFFVVIPYYIPVPAFLWCFFAWIVLGLGWGIFNSSLAIMVLDLVHPQYRTTLIAVYNTFIGFAMFISPIIGGLIIEIYQNITIIFLIRSFLMLLTITVLLSVKEPEIPGMITHPRKYLITKFLRIGAEGGSELFISPMNSIKARFPHWISIKRYFKLER